MLQSLTWGFPESLRSQRTILAIILKRTTNTVIQTRIHLLLIPNRFSRVPICDRYTSIKQCNWLNKIQ